MPTYTQDEIQNAINRAGERIRQRDTALFEYRVNERSLTHKLAEYLQAEFPDWHVDCEYNRDGHEPKRLDLEAEDVRSDDEHGTTVYPDIIVHKRGTNNNLLVIEAKREGYDNSFDRRKLGKFLIGLRYEFAVLLVFHRDGTVGMEFVTGKARCRAR